MTPLISALKARLKRRARRLGWLSLSVGALVFGSSAASAERSTTPAGPAPQLRLPPLPRLALSQVHALTDAGTVLLIDARGPLDFYTGHLPGALNLPWQSLTERGCGLRCGRLDPDLEHLRQVLTKQGLHSPAGKLVVVYGAGNQGWGEEGRAIWTLEYLGVTGLALLDGGYPAWRSLGMPVERLGSSTRPAHRPLELKLQRAVRMTPTQLLPLLKAPDLVLVDVREPSEFSGSREFGLPRGGHLPGAINLPWKTLLAPDGRLLPEAALRRVLELHHITPDKHVVTYCTGGVRSGFVYAALRTLGYARVSNYEGSMWEWAADPRLPLE